MVEAQEINPVFPDYNNSILNLSCSILQHYGITPKHPTLYKIDELLGRNPKHVVLILLDGLGMNILENKLNIRDFLRRNFLTDYSSVFPPTTTASTTTLLSGLSPIEHGWLGWDLYFEQENKTVCCFKNTLQSTDTPAAEYGIANKYLPYETIVDQINKANTAKANIVFPFGDNPHPELNDWVSAIKKSIKTDETTFTYAYWEEPDASLHLKGQKTKETEEAIRDINSALTELCETARDTLFIITADHGHISIENDFIEENYPQLADMLVRQTSIEPRAISFYVKPEFMEDFPKEFNALFGNDYVLFTKEEVIKKELFGPGEPNPNLTGIGDFVAAAVSSRTLLWNKKQKQFFSHHAGLSQEEMRIPLIAYQSRAKRNPLTVFFTILGIIAAFIFYLWIS